MGKGCGCGCLGLIVIFILLGFIGSCASDNKGKQASNTKPSVEQQVNDNKPKQDNGYIDIVNATGKYNDNVDEMTGTIKEIYEHYYNKYIAENMTNDEAVKKAKNMAANMSELIGWVQDLDLPGNTHGAEDTRLFEEKYKIYLAVGMDIYEAANKAGDDVHTARVERNKKREGQNQEQQHPKDTTFTVDGITYVFISGGTAIDPYYDKRIGVDWYAITSSKSEDKHGLVFKDDGFAVMVVCVKQGTSPSDLKNVIRDPYDVQDGFAMARFWLQNDEWKCSLYQSDGYPHEIISWCEVKHIDANYASFGNNGYIHGMATKYLDLGKVFRITKDLPMRKKE